MVKFIILATQRTGSSFLGTSLDSHPEVTCCEELFMPRNRNEITYRSYRQSSWIHRFTHLLSQQRLVHAYLDHVASSAKPGASAWGFNLMYNQAIKYPATLSWCRRNDVRIIHLLRRNLLKVLTSREVARKRKSTTKSDPVYLSTKPLPRTTVVLPVASLRTKLDQLAELVDQYRARFADSPYLELEYEMLVADQEAEISRILDFLCVKKASLHSTLIKTSPDSLRDIIENYQAVCEELRGTKYEACLD